MYAFIGFGLSVIAGAAAGLLIVAVLFFSFGFQSDATNNIIPMLGALAGIVSGVSIGLKWQRRVDTGV